MSILQQVFPQCYYQSWNCWPMRIYCPIFISWLKQKDKKVQDPVYITSNWINVLFNTPANPLIPGRWVSWESTFSSWWVPPLGLPSWSNYYQRRNFLLLSLFQYFVNQGKWSKHIDSCDAISEEHLCQDCWDPTSKSNNLEGDLKTLKQTGLFPVSSPIFSIFCWKLDGTVSIQRNLTGAEIPNLPFSWDYLVNVRQ